MAKGAKIGEALKYMNFFRISISILIALAIPVIAVCKMNSSLANKINEVKVKYVTKEDFNKTTNSFIKTIEKLDKSIDKNTAVLSRIQGYMEAKKESN